MTEIEGISSLGKMLTSVFKGAITRRVRACEDAPVQPVCVVATSAVFIPPYRVVDVVTGKMKPTEMINNEWNIAKEAYTDSGLLSATEDVVTKRVEKYVKPEFESTLKSLTMKRPKLLK